MVAGVPSTAVNQGNGIQQLDAMIRRIVQQEMARTAANSGNALHVDGATGDLVIDKGDVHSGNYVTGATGWALDNDGNAEFNDLTLRGGIIGDDALANPAAFAQSGAGAAVASIGTTAGTLTSASLTVPSGYSRAIVLAVGTLSGFASAGTNYIYVKATINTTTVAGNTTSTYASAGSPFAPATNHASTILTGLSGGSIAVRLMASAGSTITLSGGVAVLDTVVIYLR